MLPYTDEEVLAFHGGTQKQLVLTFSDGTVVTNEDISSENMSLEQSICEDSQLTFGQVSSSCFKVQLLGVTKRYKNLEVTPTISADYYDSETGETTTFTRQLGKYKVYSDTATSNRLGRDLECYDALYEVLDTDYTDWHNSQNFPMTVKSYRDAFFQHIGIEQANITYLRKDGTYGLPNDDMVIEKNFVADGYSGSDLLNSLCEINGCFGHINFEGKFRYVIIEPKFEGLYPSDELFPRDTIYPVDPEATTLHAGAYFQGTLKYEEFEIKVITQLQVRMTENDIGAVVGSEGNTYIIENNPLLYGKTSEQLTTIANNIFSVIRLPYYTPASVKLPCSPWYELGDSFKVISESDSVIICVLHRTISGITALFDTFECDGSEYYSEQANGVNRNIDILKQYTNELTRTVEQTQSTLTELRTDLDGDVEQLQSQITQTAEKIETKVSIGDVSSQISQESDKITISSDRLIVNSTNFKLTADGTITATNANMSGQLTSGTNSGKKIVIKDGVITGYNNNVKQAALEIGDGLFNIIGKLALNGVVGVSGNTSFVKSLRETQGTISNVCKIAGMQAVQYNYANGVSVTGPSTASGSVSLSGTCNVNPSTGFGTCTVSGLVTLSLNGGYRGQLTTTVGTIMIPNVVTTNVNYTKSVAENYGVIKSADGLIQEIT